MLALNIDGAWVMVSHTIPLYGILEKLGDIPSGCFFNSEPELLPLALDYTQQTHSPCPLMGLE